MEVWRPEMWGRYRSKGGVLPIRFTGPPRYLASCRIIYNNIHVREKHEVAWHSTTEQGSGRKICKYWIYPSGHKVDWGWVSAVYFWMWPNLDALNRWSSNPISFICWAVKVVTSCVLMPHKMIHCSTLIVRKIIDISGLSFDIGRSVTNRPMF